MKAIIWKYSNHTFFGFSCIAICIIIFLVGLWPLSFHPKNEVEWLQDSNGISFYGRGIAYTESFNVKSSFSDDNQVTFEILLEPLSETKLNAPYLLSFYDGKETEIITFRQWKSDLEIFRNRVTDENKLSPNSRIGLRDALLSGQKRLITVSSEKKGTKIYFNGEIAWFYPGFSLIRSREITGHLILGNSPTGKNSWKGNIFGLAIYNRALKENEISQNYQAWLKYNSPIEDQSLALLFSFDERSGTLAHDYASARQLLIPKTFQMLHKTALASPLKDFRPGVSFFTDIFVNILGFIPLGFFLPVFLYQSERLSKNRIYLVTLILAGGISLAIELIQVYLPTRHSSLTDLISNVFGTILGLVLFRLIHRTFP